MKKSFKELFSLLLLCLLLIAACACQADKFVTVACVSKNTSTEKSATYSRFDGVRNYAFTVEEGETCAIKAAFTTEEGKISASIYEKENPENRPYEGNDIPTCEFTVNITESGKYVIRLEADDHEGGYSFRWE